MYLKRILENYCFKTIQYLLFVYKIEMHYKIRIYKNRIQLEFYSTDKSLVYEFVFYLTDDYIPLPDVLAIRIYNRLKEKMVKNNE